MTPPVPAKPPPHRVTKRGAVAARRALVGAAWTLAWMLVWGSALLMFAHRTQAAPLTSAVSPLPLAATAAPGR